MEPRGSAGETYEKYRHLDQAICEPSDGGPVFAVDEVLFDLWQAVKQANIQRQEGVRGMASTNHHYLLGVVHDLLEAGVVWVQIVDKEFEIRGDRSSDGKKTLTMRWPIVGEEEK